MTFGRDDLAEQSDDWYKLLIKHIKTQTTKDKMDICTQCRETIKYLIDGLRNMSLQNNSSHVNYERDFKVFQRIVRKAKSFRDVTRIRG